MNRVWRPYAPPAVQRGYDALLKLADVTLTDEAATPGAGPTDSRIVTLTGNSRKISHEVR
jgi:hypothetical protein